MIFKHKSINKGQSLVETAVVLPILLLLIMGIIDFGLIFNKYILISNASREGARKAALGGSDGEIVQTIQNMVPTLELANLHIHISPSQYHRGHGSQVKVSMTYNCELITPIIERFFPGGTVELNSSTVMRVE